MNFDVAADRYDRFMGRYSRQLAPQLTDLAGVQAGDRVLDVGCGPGALTAELVARVGAANVAAIDPSPSFVEAARGRHPGVTVRQGWAEDLPFDEASFDAAMAQLVVHFMSDPEGGLREMARVTKPGGSVAACVWDYGGRDDPLRVYWQAAREVDPSVVDESELAGARDGHLVELFEAAGLHDVCQSELWSTVEHESFDAWWEPFTYGVGPSGAHLVAQSPERQDQIKTRARSLLRDGPFSIRARAWAAQGRV